MMALMQEQVLTVIGRIEKSLGEVQGKGMKRKRNADMNDLICMRNLVIFGGQRVTCGDERPSTCWNASGIPVLLPGCLGLAFCSCMQLGLPRRAKSVQR